jgi:hypothetical protein
VLRDSKSQASRRRKVLFSNSFRDALGPLAGLIDYPSGFCLDAAPTPATMWPGSPKATLPVSCEDRCVRNDTAEVGFWAKVQETTQLMVHRSGPRLGSEQRSTVAHWVRREAGSLPTTTRLVESGFP